MSQVSLWGWDYAVAPLVPQWQKVHLDRATGNLQVDVIASGLPALAATAANQTTIIGHIDGIEGALGQCYGYDGGAWQRLRVETAANANLRVALYGADSRAYVGAGSAAFTYATPGLQTFATLYGDDGTNVSRVGMLLEGADAVDNALNTLGVASMLYGYNGATWDRLRVDTDKNLKVADSFGGNVYSKTMTMEDNNPTRFETDAKKLRDIVIIVTTHPMLLGETGVVVYPVGVNETIGWTKVDISTLWFQNANADDDGVITILGVEE